MKYKNYIYFSFGGKELTVFESQVLPWIEIAKKKFQNVSLIILSGFRSRKEKGVKEFCKDHNVLIYHSFSPLFFIPTLWMDIGMLFFKLYKYRNIFNNSIIHCRSEISGYIALKLMQLFNTQNYKIVCDIRADLIDELINGKKNKVLKYMQLAVLKHTLINCCKNCDLLSFVTSNLKNVIEKRTGIQLNNKYIIIPSLVSYKFKFDPDSRRKKRKEFGISLNIHVWIYIGGLDYWQNPEELKNFVKDKIKNKNKFFIFLTQHLSIANRIFKDISNKNLIVKKVSYSEIPDFLNASDIGIIIRNNTSTNYCAAPVKLAEYLCNGLEVYHTGEIGILKDLPKIGNPIKRLEKSKKYLEFFNINTYFKKLIDKLERYN